MIQLGRSVVAILVWFCISFLFIIQLLALNSCSKQAFGHRTLAENNEETPHASISRKMLEIVNNDAQRSEVAVNLPSSFVFGKKTSSNKRLMEIKNSKATKAASYTVSRKNKDAPSTNVVNKSQAHPNQTSNTAYEESLFHVDYSPTITHPPHNH